MDQSNMLLAKFFGLIHGLERTGQSPKEGKVADMKYVPF
jgi:hypothetical protein